MSKTILITGGSRGIGAATARLAAMRGYHVCINYLNRAACAQQLADDIGELGGKADVVMSDMAAASSGHKQTDHLRIMALCEAAAWFAFDVLSPGGTFVAKVLAGGAEGELQAELKRRFEKVFHMKPPSSRKDSSEKFVIARGYRGQSEAG